MALPTYTAGDTPEMLDSRDLIEWAEFNRDTIEEMDDDDRTTLAAIDELEAEGWEDWIYGAQFIRDDYFKQYAQELADDIGAIDSGAGWPASYIDWDAASDALQMDYSPTEYLGVTYWAR